jgi:hypothetical protein
VNGWIPAFAGMTLDASKTKDLNAELRLKPFFSIITLVKYKDQLAS